MYYKLNGKNIEEVSIEDWYKKNNPLSKTLFKNTFGEVDVSTIFMAMDHNFVINHGDEEPILFETMVFGGEHDNYQERYHTYDEAEEGHKRICEMVDKIAIDRDKKLGELGI